MLRAASQTGAAVSKSCVGRVFGQKLYKMIGLGTEPDKRTKGARVKDGAHEIADILIRALIREE